MGFNQWEGDKIEENSWGGGLILPPYLWNESKTLFLFDYFLLIFPIIKNKNKLAC